MLDNFLGDERKTESNRHVFLWMDNENTMERTCKQRRSLKKKGNEHLYTEIKRDSCNIFHKKGGGGVAK